MAKCLVPGCTNNAENNISIRCRRLNTSAIWAPNTEAFLCDAHADQGFSINISLRPDHSRTITTDVSAGGHHETRTTPIVHFSKE